MKIIDFEFEHLPDSAQFCSNTVIYAFHDVGFIEFKAYCMINSMAQPIAIEIEETGENSYICHIVTSCELTAMSEKCILLKGKLECKQVNQQLQLSVRERLVSDEGLQ